MLSCEERIASGGKDLSQRGLSFGSSDVESSEAEGTRFIVQLPRHSKDD